MPLIDGTRKNGSRKTPRIKVDSAWDLCIVPSERPLYAILADVVRHSTTHPRHGIGCSCMDTFSWEMRAHIQRVLPRIERVQVELDPNEWHDPGDEWVEVPGTVKARMDAIGRVQVILATASRNLHL